MNVIKFYRVSEPYGFFSNFAPYPVVINNEIWPTVEHYFQASKFDDNAIKLKIKQMESPMEAATEGRNRNNIIRTEWEAVKEKIMQKALLSKFLQHPSLRKELILTGASKLIEHTHKDSFWGDGGDGTGKNRLGFLLEEIGTVIQEYSSDPNLVLPPWIAFPSINPHDMFWRMGLGEDFLTQWASYYLQANKGYYQELFPASLEWHDIYE